MVSVGYIKTLIGPIIHYNTKRGFIMFKQFHGVKKHFRIILMGGGGLKSVPSLG